MVSPGFIPNLVLQREHGGQERAQVFKGSPVADTPGGWLGTSWPDVRTHTALSRAAASPGESVWGRPAAVPA